jgi:hypothetical protein
MLYTAGCDPTAPGDRGLSLLHFAIQSLSREFIQSGLQSPPYTTPGFPWTRIDVERFLSVLEFPLALSMMRLWTPRSQDAHGCNALRLVSSHIHGFDDTSVERVVRMLVEHGCDANCQNDASETLLQIAMSSRLSLHTLDVFLLWALNCL